MARVTPAARQLVAEVEGAQQSSVTWGTYGEPDGLGRYRSIQFGEDETEWLAPVIEASTDKRIASHEVDDGHLVVTFVSDVRADRIQSFGIKGAKDVLDDKPAKKPAAKKAAKRPTKKAAKKS